MARNTVTPFVSVNLKQLEIYIHISVCVCVHIYTYIHIYIHDYPFIWASLVAQTVKNPPAMWETWF